MRRLAGTEIIIILAIALLLAPLERATNWAGLISLPWNANVLLQALLLVSAYFFFLLRERKLLSSSLIFSLLITVIIGLSVGTRQIEYISWEVVLSLLIATWWLPLILEIAKRQQRVIAIFVVISITSLHAWWGITQFILQADLNLNFLGETSLLAGEAGLATFTFQSAKLLRAYGPYPHPNILSGAMLAGIILLLATPQIFRQRIFSLPVLWLLSLGLLVTISRSALMGLVISLSLFYLFRFSRARHSGWAKPFLILALTLFVFIPFWLLRFQDPMDLALSDRRSGARNAIQIGEKYGWSRGVGPGNYSLALNSYAEDFQLDLLPWQLGPVHSAPLLMMLEWGIFLTGLFLLVVLGPIVVAGSFNLLLLLGLLPTIFLDHYWLTHLGSLILLAIVYSLLTSHVTMKRLWRVPRAQNYHTTDNDQ